MRVITRTYPTVFALVGDLFAANTEAGIPEGAGPLDAAEAVGEIGDALLERGRSRDPWRITIELEFTGEYSPGFEPVRNWRGELSCYGWQGSRLQCFSPLGRVTIEPAKHYALRDRLRRKTLYEQWIPAYAEWCFEMEPVND